MYVLRGSLVPGEHFNRFTFAKAVYLFASHKAAGVLDIKREIKEKISLGPARFFSSVAVAAAVAVADVVPGADDR